MNLVSRLTVTLYLTRVSLTILSCHVGFNGFEMISAINLSASTSDDLDLASPRAADSSDETQC